jgi:peptidoglycan/LPS O-acetylase OafA/YrhL
MSSSKPIPFSRTTASVHLDATRALAALLVCLGHWRNLLFVSYPQLHAAHRSLFAISYVLTDAGHQAVMIFFVLSGYLISGSIYRMMATGTWSWRRYLTHRVVRLWIVLIPALLLGALLDGAGLHLHAGPALYAGQVQNSLGTDVAAHYTVSRFFACLFFLQGIVIHGSFGSNGPLWSLANEFWYYILFPLGLVACRRSFSGRVRIPSGLLFLLAAWFVGKGIMLEFPIWLLGSVIAALQVPRFSVGLRGVILAVYPLVFFYLSKARWIPSVPSDYLLGIATFFFILCLLNDTTAAPSTRWVGLSRVGARFSYTLYVVHFPLLLLLTSLLVGDSRWYPDPRHILLAVLPLVAVICYAYGVAWLTEFRTDQVRPWVESFILPRRRTSEATVAGR